MSSPSRLLRGRPTAPLPTQYASHSVNSLHKEEATMEKLSPSFSGYNKTNSSHRRCHCHCCTSVDVDVLSSDERIKNYLKSHKTFLEDLILEDVPQETLERILVEKSQRTDSTSDLKLKKYNLDTTKDESKKAICSAQNHECCSRQQKLIGAYKKITKMMSESNSDTNTVMQLIDQTITGLVNADRSALFLVDCEGKTLYAQLFSVSKKEESLVTLKHFENKCIGEYLNQLGRKPEEVVCYKGRNITVSIDKGVAGYTAKTGKTQNITNAKSCPYFCTEIDELTGYRTETVLCAPVRSAGKVMGVLEAVNKKSGVFTKSDEECLLSLAEFVGLIMTNFRTKEKLFTAENRLKVAQEILAFHRPCSDDHLQRVKAMSLSTEHLSVVQNMSIKTSVLSLDVKAQLAVAMFTDLMDGNQFQFDQDCLLRFTLTVAKNYRGEEYHNWDHAFSVAHCMYWLIKGAPERFSDLERMSLFWGCLCHDLDHRGYNNTFLVKTEAPLAKLYSSSVLENHHFSQAVSLLQLEDHNIFACLSSEQYKQVITIMQNAILATDLVLFFRNKDQFLKIVDSGEFSWDVPRHKELVLSLMMTTSDLCSSCKVWEDHRHSVDALFEEFYLQGDEEKAMGLKPLEMIDRDFKHKLASCQVGFLKSITCPCCELLVTALPHVENLLRNAQNNMNMWEKISKESTTD